jgi:hypothetical protein
MPSSMQQYSQPPSSQQQMQYTQHMQNLQNQQQAMAEKRDIQQVSNEYEDEEARRKKVNYYAHNLRIKSIKLMLYSKRLHTLNPYREISKRHGAQMRPCRTTSSNLSSPLLTSHTRCHCFNCQVRALNDHTMTHR